MKLVLWRHWCMSLRCIQRPQRTNFTAPSCTVAGVCIDSERSLWFSFWSQGCVSRWALKVWRQGSHSVGFVLWPPASKLFMVLMRLAAYCHTVKEEISVGNLNPELSNNWKNYQINFHAKFSSNRPVGHSNVSSSLHCFSPFRKNEIKFQTKGFARKSTKFFANENFSFYSIVTVVVLRIFFF